MSKTYKIFLLCLLFLIFVVGCKNNLESENTIGTILANNFEKEIIKSNDINLVLENLSKTKELDIMMDITKLEEDNKNLSGFSKEITNYNEVYVMRPMIGTIPFISYVFVSDNVNELEKEIKDSYDLRWNVCTVADSMNMKIVDNYLFFVMSPDSFD